VALKAKTIGTFVVILVLAVGSIIAYNWKAITPPAVQTTTTARTGPTMMRIKIPDNGCYLGSYIDGAPPISSQQIKDFERMVGKQLAIMCMNYVGRNEGAHSFPSQDMTTVLQSGSIPMIGWYPLFKDWRKAPPTLQDIIDGRCDDLIEDWASNMRLLQYPILVRLGWEMNFDIGFWSGLGNFGPLSNRMWNEVDNLYAYYGDPKKPDGPERYVDAWKHIRNIFDKTVVKNAVWVWCPLAPSVPDVEWNKPENYYPGDDFVDFVGCDLYNNGYWIDTKGQARPNWREFKDNFEKTSALQIYTSHRNKPFIVAELGCVEESLPNVTGPKAKWITNTYYSIKNTYSNIKAVCWFSKNRTAFGERNWRVDSSPESLEAYKKAISDPYFLDRIIVETSGLTSSFATFLCVPELHCCCLRCKKAAAHRDFLSNPCVIAGQYPDKNASMQWLGFV